MNIKLLNSIAELTAADCLQTNGSKPLRVLCSDFNYYICKYFKGVGPAYSLFNEFIASKFLFISGIAAPEFSLVNVSTHHTAVTNLPYSYFDIPCFGSKKLDNVQEADSFLAELAFSSAEYDNARISFLDIALFDIWLSNEDRTQNNYNLLFDYVNNIFVPIDHVQIFSGNNLDKEPVLITFDESIINSMLFAKIFSRILQTNIQNLRSDTTTKFQLNCHKCHENLPGILQDLTPEWRLDKEYLAARMSYLFTDEWISGCINTFNEFLQISFNHKSR